MQNVIERRSAPAPSGSDVLRIPGESEPIGSLSEFERLLKPRTAVPSQRYARFLALGDEALASAGVTTRYAAEHLRRMLEDLRGRSGRIDTVLGGMSPTFFSEDHGWRALFGALLDSGSAFTEYKLVAVANYRRYLMNCLDALSGVSTDRLQSTLCFEAQAREEENTVFKGAAQRGYDSSKSREEVFVRDLVRLPRGTTMQLRKHSDAPFELWMGKRRFRIETWAGALLVDEQGTGSSLHDGRNLVGRGLYNDVIVDSGFCDVSRRHLIIDLMEGVPTAITDLSSAGTYLSRSLVDAAA